VQFEGRKFYLGSFDTELAAARAYDLAAKKIQKDFCRPNFNDNNTTLDSAEG